jgi:fused signal recognition particle receptor
MEALWIVLGVVLLVLLVGAGAVVTRSRRRATPLAPSPMPGLRTPAPSTAPDEGDDPGSVAAPPGPPSMRARLGGTRGRLGSYLSALRVRGALDGPAWDELEEALLGADVGVPTTGALLETLRVKARAGELRDASSIPGALADALIDVFAQEDDRTLHLRQAPGATDVWLFVGVNGVGKTTTVGKVARAQQAAGHSVLLAAGDTFRAAAGEQLELWAERTGVEVVRGAEGGDPSAIVYDAVQRAAARGNDLVLADTAGRLHTKVNLIEELKKIRRVADRPPGVVSEVLLVLDATTGQNGLIQARQFTEAVDVTGIVLTKLDGTAKGGVVVAIERELRIPVKLVGLGEGPDDLIAFDPEAFVDALIER